MMADLRSLVNGLPSSLPTPPPRDSSVPHAPGRPMVLTAAEKKVSKCLIFNLLPKKAQRLKVPLLSLLINLII